MGRVVRMKSKELDPMASIKCGNCKQIHTSAADVKSCYNLKEKNTMSVFVPAHRQSAAYQAIKAQATAVIAAPVVTVMQEVAPTQQTENAVEVVLKGQDLKVDALYKMGDEVYKIIWNKAQTHKYAMRLVFASWMKKGRFQYAPGIINQLDSTMQMDLDGAKGFAKWAFEKFNVGVCCNCGKLLTNPVSVAEGIGPVCSGKIKKSWY
jgi:hypothetical protein